MGGLNIDWNALDSAAQDGRDNEAANTQAIEAGPPPDSSSAPDDLNTVAQQNANSIFDQTNPGQGAGNNAVANTATIAGDYASGETYGNPTPTGGPHWGNRLDTIPPGPTGGAPSLPMASAPPSATTSGYNQPLLGGTPVTGPQLPGGTPVTGPQLPGAASAGGDLTPGQRVQRDAAGNVIGVASANGSFDPRYQGTSDANGHQSLMTEYLRGDRMPGTVDALRILADGNFGDLSASAKSVLGAEAATSSNVMGSPLEQHWAQLHNPEAQANADKFLAQGNKAAAQNALGQQVQVNQSPLSNSESFPMAQKMVDDLNQITGVSNVKFDGVNVVFQDASHVAPNNPTGVAHIPMNEWADWYPVIADRLQKQNTPAPAASAANGGSGGGRPPPRGTGGGGNAPPPAAPPAKSGIPTPETGPDLTQTQINKTRYQQTPMG